MELKDQSIFYKSKLFSVPEPKAITNYTSTNDKFAKIGKACNEWQAEILVWIKLL